MAAGAAAGGAELAPAASADGGSAAEKGGAGGDGGGGDGGSAGGAGSSGAGGAGAAAASAAKKLGGHSRAPQASMAPGRREGAAFDADGVGGGELQSNCTPLEAYAEARRVFHEAATELLG